MWLCVRRSVAVSKTGSCVHTREKELIRLRRSLFTKVDFRESTRVYDTGDQSLYIVLLIITRISAQQRYKSQGGETQETVASYGYLPRRSPRG